MSNPVADSAVEHYSSQRYLTKERFCSFWHQTDEALKFGGRSVLEIGPGPGITAELLRQGGVEVTTCDYDPSLSPDIVADAAELPIETDAYDVVVCCQVLEHLEFEHARRALCEIGRVARVGAVVSVPDLNPWVGAAYPLYFGWMVDRLREQYAGRPRECVGALLRRRLRLREFAFLTLVPARWAYGGPVWEPTPALIPHRNVRLKADDDHRWEIGANGITFEAVVEAIADAGLRVDRDYRVPENPWHHFFVLSAAEVSTKSPSA